MILVGGSGSGKTHLATALATEACARGKRVRFFRVTELATVLLEAREERQLARLRSQLAKLDLLVLDELGYVPASQVGAELLFDVISTAYERSSVIVTTNLPEGGAGEPAADGCHPRQADPPVHDRRDREGELPAEGGTPPPARGVGRGGMRP